MKIRELKALVKEKLNTGMTKQETFDLIVSLNVIRIHDVANAVRDTASNYYKQKYKKQNYLLIVMILLAGIIQSTSSILFPEKADLQTLPSNIFLMLTYAAVAFGIYAYYKLSYSAAILLSIISMYMSIQNLIIHEKMIAEIFYYLVISAIGLIIICMSGILYSKYFRGYDIKPVGKGENNRMETYVFKEEK